MESLFTIAWNTHVNPVSPSYAATAIVTATIQLAQTAGTVGDAKVLIGFADNGSSYSFSPQELPVISSTMTTYALQWEFAHSAANGGLGQATIYVDLGSTSDTVNWQQATVQVEYILR